MKLEAGDVFPWGLGRGASDGSEGCDDRASDAWKNRGVPDVVSEKEFNLDLGWLSAVNVFDLRVRDCSGLTPRAGLRSRRP